MFIYHGRCNAHQYPEGRQEGVEPLAMTQKTQLKASFIYYQLGDLTLSSLTVRIMALHHPPYALAIRGRIMAMDAKDPLTPNHFTDAIIRTAPGDTREWENRFNSSIIHSAVLVDGIRQHESPPEAKFGLILSFSSDSQARGPERVTAQDLSVLLPDHKNVHLPMPCPSP